MLSALLLRRWSTLSLLGFGLGLGALVYWVAPHGSGARSATTAPNAPGSATPGSPAALNVRPMEGKTGTTPSSNKEIRSVDERWAQLSAERSTPAAAAARAAFLDDLASHNPKQALALALAEPNFRVRESLRNAVLRGWASAAPDEAAAWALALPEHDRPPAIEAVFAGAGRKPEDAVRFGERLFAQNPAFADAYGQMLITALTDSGAYETALRFSTSGTSPNHVGWLNATFYQWAAYQPEQANAALAKITEPQARAEAFDAFVLGWAGSKPASLATYALALPPGPDRSKALSQALDQWVAQDAITAAEWVSKFNSTPDLDAGVASVATSLNMLSQSPEIAAGLAESISDPTLRAETLQRVARHWEERVSGGVRRFIETTPNLSPADGAALLQGLSPTPVNQKSP